MPNLIVNIYVLRERLKATRHWLAQRLQGLEADDSNVIKSKDELLQPYCCATAL